MHGRDSFSQSTTLGRHQGSQSERPYECSEWETDCGRAQNSSADSFIQGSHTGCLQRRYSLDGMCYL